MNMSIFLRWQVRQILEGNIDPAVLLKSRFNCHIKGLHSVPIRETNGRLTRIFFTDTDHVMHKNGNLSTMSLGAHNHRYNITLTGLCGSAVNVNIIKAVDSGKPLHHFEYMDGEKMRYLGKALAQISGIQAIGPQPIFMPASDIHTVFVPQYEKAAWLVDEGETVSDTVDLFSIDRQPVCKFKQAKELAEIQNFVRTWAGDL